jgi:hypothetical protein
VCGREVLYLQGEPLRDAAWAANALDRAWHVRPGQPTASSARLGAGERILAAHQRAAGRVAARIAETFEVARSHPEAATRHADDEVTIALPSGLVNRARLGPTGGWRWQAADEERGTELRAYLQQATGYALASSAPRGASRGLIGALDR